MGSLLRATTLWGYGELVQELGGDPELFFKRFRIPPGIENQEDAFISFDAYVRMLEASAEDLGCPDFGLRLSRWQGLDILGPIAVIARNAHTVLGGLEMIGRYLYVHSPALKLTLAPRTAKTGLTFAYEITESGLPRWCRATSSAWPSWSGSFVCWPDRRRGPARFLSRTTNRARTRLTEKRWGARCASDRRGADSRYPSAWPADGSRALIRRPDALRRNTLSPLSSAHSVAVGTCGGAVRRLLPTGQCTVDAIADQLAMHPRSLQRHLVTEGVRCQDLIDRERRTLAGTYLAEPGLHLSQSPACSATPNRAPLTGHASVGSGRHLGSTEPA